jgi:hypothetical protein
MIVSIVFTSRVMLLHYLECRKGIESRTFNVFTEKLIIRRPIP